MRHRPAVVSRRGSLPPGLLTSYYPVRVVSVDGSIQFHNPVQVAQGSHWLVLEAAPSASARRTVQRSFVFATAPCTRYYLAASRESPVAAEWELVVALKETVSGCNAEEELKK